MDSFNTDFRKCKCQLWCRADFNQPLTNHHPNCPHVDDSLIDVWKIEYDGACCYTDDIEGMDIQEGEKVTKEKMHKEVYEHLPDFEGF